MARGHRRAPHIVEREHLLERRRAAAGKRNVIEGEMRNKPPVRRLAPLETHTRRRALQQRDVVRERPAFEKKVAALVAGRQRRGQVAIRAGQIDR